MEKKLKINFILKGIAVFAFVAFCLLAILAGVTLPFVSNASTLESAVSSSESDCATASAESDTSNLLDFCIPLSQCNTTDTYYGFYVTQDFYNIIKTYDFGDIYIHLVCNFSIVGSGVTSLCYLVYDTDVNNKVLRCGYGDYMLFDLGSSLIPYSYNNVTYVTDKGFKFSSIETNTFNNSLMVFNQLPFGGDTTELENQIATLTAEKATLQGQLTEKQNQIDTLIAEKVALQTQVNDLTGDKAALQSQLTEKQNQLDTLTAEKNTLQNQLFNMNFISHFGNFDNLGSSDFYVNLSSDIVLPEIFYQFTNNSTPINGWFLKGSGANMEIYGLNLFDRFYYNGTQEFGFLNCGFQLTIKSIPSTTIPPSYITQCKLDFVVFDTLVWSADCDIDYNTDTKVETISNIRNGSFKVTANYDKDTNVYKFTVSDNKLFLLNENYNKAYDTFRSFVVQQDYKKTKIPSDNALYLNGYQSASKEFYNNGYNDGVAVGEKSGYNKGFSAGDAQGYNRGVEVGGNYSFLGLFGAIFDAPIQAIFGGTTTLPAGTTITDKNGNTTTLLTSATVKRAGLLNFDIMGVNLSGFVLALFSLSILVVVIKFALAKGR